jgi:DNA-directed RNA polymerase subunit RPC12/RpoP
LAQVNIHSLSLQKASKMGYSYIFNCRKCKYSQQLYEGWRFMEHDQTVQSVLDSKQINLHYKTRNKITALAKQGQQLQIKTEYKIYRCHKCLQISDKLVVQVLADGQILHETQFKCANCNSKLKHTNIHRLKFAICPKCKSKRFEKTKALVLWN